MFKSLVKPLVIALIFVVGLVLTYYYLQEDIQQSQNKHYQHQLEELLVGIKFNNDIAKSQVLIKNPEYLNTLGILQNQQQKVSALPVYVARQNGSPTAVIIETNAPDGYNGNIGLLVAIKLQPGEHNTIHKIKVLQHKETPGLGDAIESEKSTWLNQFTDKISNNLYVYTKNDPSTQGAVNAIDSISGATITSKAVTNAVQKALDLVDNHMDIYQNKSP